MGELTSKVLGEDLNEIKTLIDSRTTEDLNIGEQIASLMQRRAALGNEIKVLQELILIKTNQKSGGKDFVFTLATDGDEETVTKREKTPEEIALEDEEEEEK